jgi:hypothetical protein
MRHAKHDLDRPFAGGDLWHILCRTIRSVKVKEKIR